MTQKRIFGKIFSDPVSAFTGLLALFTLVMNWMAFRQEASQQRIERSYIFIEVQLDKFANSVIDAEGSWGEIRAIVKFWNYGKTPAIVSMIRGYIVITDTTPQSLIESDDSEKSLPPSLGISTNNAYEVTLIKKNDI